ncbi:prolyl oligopeptidase family serine peptidase [Chitinophaga sp.]|uniref:alpha/beta hydrolase family protein n=1 Tax=Chitinophaga sp. TaxID=1869181 RepID=UPI0031DC816A
MRHLLIVLFLFGHVSLYSQKKPLDIEDLKLSKWSFVNSPQISNDGRFLVYYASKATPDSVGGIVLKRIDGSQMAVIRNGRQPLFSSDSKNLACISVGGNLLLIDLVSSDIDTISGVSDFFWVNKHDSTWLAAYRKDLQTNSGRLDFINSKSRSVLSYPNINMYLTSADGNRIVVEVKIDSINSELRILDPEGKSSRAVYRGLRPLSLLIDKSGRQMAFLIDDMHRKSFRYMEFEKDSVVQGNFTPRFEVDDDVELDRLSTFSNDGKSVFCMLRRTKKEGAMKGKAKVSIWSTEDARLKSQVNSRAKEDMFFQAIWNPKSNKVIQLRHKEDDFFRPYTSYSVPCNNAELLSVTKAYFGEWNWNENAIASRLLLNYDDASLKRISGPEDRNSNSYILSSSGKWIVYFDAELKSYFSYEVASARRRNITKNISAVWTTFDNDDIPFSNYITLGLGGFSDDDRWVYIYDQYDIYKVDLTGTGDYVNVTNGYGKANSIVFRFALPFQDWKEGHFLLNAFSRASKENGFFDVEKNNPRSLKKLTFENAIFMGVEESKYMSIVPPIKAKDTSVYIVRKMTASIPTNFYVTSDFVTFKPVTDCHPERNYNGLTTELVSFKALDGKSSQGILYKPENFDPNKRYPLIFFYYEKISECLNYFIRPDYCEATLNIPYFVSNGYLVFAPDIHFEIGYPGRSSLYTVMGAANTLLKRKYIDSTKMGLQGHSFGGFQTNYIVTHTSRFSAACSASGFTNFLSSYGSIIGDGYSRQGQFELYRDRIGASPWDRLDLYTENSPVVRADKVSTPLLLMHNSDDSDVPFGQAAEFFTGLRRLGKTAFLLQYDEFGHVLDGDAARDYTIRMMSFFNYYLKSGPLPDWMDVKPLRKVTVKM